MLVNNRNEVNNFHEQCLGKMLPVASVCELSKQIIEFLDLSILFEYLVIFSLSKSWYRAIHKQFTAHS